MTTLPSRRAPIRALLLAGVLSCGGGGTEPIVQRTPASLSIVAGDGQQAIVGTELANAVVVRVVDASNQPVPGQLVNFRVTSGGGSVFAGSATTNADGEARERWTLGTHTADLQRLEARAVDNTTGAPLVFATFTATATAGTPVAISKVAGDGQSAVRGTAVAVAPRVLVVDQYANPRPGVTVSFAVLSGGGTLSSGTAVTGADGTASVGWTLGPVAGPNSLSAGFTGPALAVTFTATGLLPASQTTVGTVRLSHTRPGTMAINEYDGLYVTVLNQEGGIMPPGTFTASEIVITTSNPPVGSLSVNTIAPGDTSWFATFAPAAAGTTQLTATVRGVTSAPVTATVSPYRTDQAVSIAFSPATLTLVRGTSFSYPEGILNVVAQNFRGESIVPPAVSPVSSNPSLVGVGGSGPGILVAANSTGTGSVTITGTAAGLPPFTATVSVVMASPPAASVTVTPNPASMYEGTSLQFTAVVRDASGNVLTDRPISWNFTAGPISATGLATPLFYYRNGPYTVTARTPEGVQGSASVTVMERKITSVETTPNPFRVALGGTAMLKVAMKDSVGVIVQRYYPEVRFAAANTGIVFLDEAGAALDRSMQVLAKGLALGSTTIDFTVPNRGTTLTFSVPVTVYAPAHVEITPSTTTLAIGATRQLSATVVDDFGTPVADPITSWSTSNPAVATVSASGLVTAVGGGNVTITATSQSGKTGSAGVFVSP